MALVSKLQRAVRERTGKLIVGGTALGLGSVGAAVAQEGALTSSSGDEPIGTERSDDPGTTVDVEGEEVVVPAAEEDELLEDSLDGEDGAALETTADTPASPDTPPSPADEESPPSPETTDEESPPSPETADEESPPSPETADEESPPSPDSPTDDDESPDSPESP